MGTALPSKLGVEGGGGVGMTRIKHLRECTGMIMFWCEEERGVGLGWMRRVGWRRPVIYRRDAIQAFDVQKS